MKTLKIATTLLLVVLATGKAYAQESREYEIKAAYLVNFGRYFTWPKSSLPRAESPFVMGVIGSAPVDSFLSAYARSKTLQDHPIEFHHYQSIDDIKTCHILFVSSNVDQKTRDAVIKKVADQPAVIVGEGEGFLAEGGTITFLLVQNKVRLRISKSSAMRLGLKPSSKLLQVAEVVD